MSNSETTEYWTPVDNFILKIVEKYGSLAMVNPRIQSPYDLIRHEDLNSPVRKFRFTKRLRSFYLKYIEKSSLIDPEDCRSDTEDEDDTHKGDDIHTGDSFNEVISDVSLMRHPPVLGHWLKESGFITPEDMKKDHEYSYKEYVEIFSSAKDKTKTRKRLFPSFEGLLITDRILSVSRDQNGDKCLNEDEISTIYAVDENIGFNSIDGKFNNYSVQRLYPYNFEYENDTPEVFSDEKENYKIVFANISKICNDIEIDGKNYNFSYPLSIFNDKTFSKIDENNGFFSTSIIYAYHMNFDLNASYQIVYPKESSLNEKGTRVRKYTSLKEDIRTTGRILIREKVNASDCVVDTIQIYKNKNGNGKNEFFGSSKKFLNFIENFTDESKSKSWDEWDELYKIWKALPVIDNPDKILIDQSVYASYYDYYWQDNKLHQITSKSFSNYFWFMYGSLPINKIYYEDLVTGLSKNSFIDYNKKDGNEWNTHNMKKIFKAEDKALATEYNKDEFMTIYKQCIKFLSLVWGITTENIKELNFLTVPMYYIPNSGTSIAHVDMKIEMLDRAHPKIGSLNYKPTAEIAEKKIEKHPENESEKDYAIKILSKINNLDIENPLSKNDIDFLERNNLLTNTAKKLYDQLGNKIDNVDVSKLQALINDIKNNKNLIEDFSNKTPIPLDTKIKVSEVVKRIDEKLDFHTVNVSINTEIRARIREVINYILSSPDHISKDMILYLISWKIIDDDNIVKYFEDKNLFVKGLTDETKTHNYIRIVDVKDEEKYKKFIEKLNTINYQKDEFYEDRKSINPPGKDRNAKSEQSQTQVKNRDRDGSKKGGDKGGSSQNRGGGGGGQQNGVNQQNRGGGGQQNGVNQQNRGGGGDGQQNGGGKRGGKRRRNPKK